MRLLKEFAVEIAWKGENRYEGTRALLNSHEGLCECSMHVTYPKEVLRVEYKKHSYMIDTEGYLLCSTASAL